MADVPLANTLALPGVLPEEGIFKLFCKMTMVAQVCNPSTWDIEVRGSDVHGHLQLHNKFILIGAGGVSEFTVASRVTSQGRKEGRLVQRDSVAGVSSHFRTVTLSNLF